MHATKLFIAKLHKVLTTSARAAIGHYCLYKSVSYMLDKCKWLPLDKMILNSSLNVLHNVFTNHEPKAILSLFKLNRRSVAKIYTQYIPKNRELKNFYIYKSIKTYNKLSNDIKGLNKSRFKTKIKSLFRNNQIPDTYD